MDSAGNVYLAGYAYPTGFPITPGAYQGPNEGFLHVFITKLNSNGSALIYSSLFGGNQNDLAYSIAVDSSGNAYVAGFTGSTDFPETYAFQVPVSPVQAFVVKMNPSGSSLVYSSLFGAGQAQGIAVDSSGCAYVTGFTTSYLFPTAGPMHTNLNQNFHAFVAKLDPSGASLIYSVPFGGSSVDQANKLAIDNAGNVYVTGRTQSADFPTVNAIQPIYSGGTLCEYDCSDAFVTVLSADGSKFLFSTYLGDIGFDVGYGIAADPLGSIYAVGFTRSEYFPVVKPYQSGLIGGANAGNAFLAKIAMDLSIAPQRLVFGPAPLGSFQRQGLGMMSAPQAVTFTNNSSSAVTFSADVITGTNSSDFQIASDNCSGSVVQPNGNCIVLVSFTPSGVGIRAANLEMSNSSAEAPFFVSLLGNGSAVTFSPPAVTFGPQTPGTTSQPQVLTMTNNGQAPISISSLALTENTQLFSIANDGCTGVLLTMGGSCAVSFVFSPFSNSIGQFPATLNVVDSASDSPQSVQITGIGAGPVASFSNYGLLFTNDTVGATGPSQLVTLTNTGTSPLIVSAITNTLSDFPSTNNCTSPIPATGSCTIQVNFTPAAGGGREGSLLVTDNAPGSPQLIGAMGTGADFSLTAAPQTLTLASGGSATSRITVGSLYATFESPVALRCQAPAGLNCLLSNTTVTPGSKSAQVSATISVASAEVIVGRSPNPRLLALGALLGLLVVWNLSVQRHFRFTVAVATVVLIGLLTSCGGGGGSGSSLASGSSNSSSGGSSSGGTTSSQSIMIVGSSGPLVHSQSITITVE